MITKRYIQQESRRKKYCEMAGQVYPIHFIP